MDTAWICCFSLPGSSGIRAYYAEASDLVGKSVLVVCNLKPAKLGGFPSNGMVFCGTSEDKSKVEFVEPPAEALPGERVACEGWVMPEPASANQVRQALRCASPGLLRTWTLRGFVLLLPGSSVPATSLVTVGLSAGHPDS
jgi:tRNA-binding EMAP/Myf-like protein